MTDTSQDERSVRVAITADMLARFRTNAPAALARRSPAWLRGQILGMAQWLVIGVTGLLGLYAWHWSATGLLIVFLAGLMSGLLADLVKWVVFRRRIAAAFDQLNDDRLVWAIVWAAIQKKDTLPPDALKTTNAGMAVTVDLYAGLFAGAIFYLGLRHLGVDLLDEFRAQGGLSVAILAVVILPWIPFVETVATVRHGGDGYDTLGFESGGRGGALFLIAIVFMFLAERPSAVHGLMVFVYGGTALVAAMAAIGFGLMTRERRWLAAHLPAVAAGQPVPGLVPTSADAPVQGKRKKRR